MSYCPFCDANVTSKQSFYETETEYAIYNISPVNIGQCLVVPKRHVASIHELTDKEAESLFKTVKLVAGKLKEYLSPESFNYGFNEGSYAGQTVFHFHFHILPRFLDDSMQEYHLFHRDPETKIKLTEEEMETKVLEFRNLFS